VSEVYWDTLYILNTTQSVLKTFEAIPMEVFRWLNANKYN